MAIVQGILSDGQILGFKGQIDFYYQRGQLVARKWPKPPSGEPTEAVKAERAFFAAVNRSIGLKSEASKEAWKNYVSGTTITWTDPIRWYAYQNNDLRLLEPNLTLYDVSVERLGSFWYLTITLKKDQGAADPNPDCLLLYNWSYDEYPPVTWEFVGYKCRKRALSEKRYAPQQTGKFAQARLVPLPGGEYVQTVVRSYKKETNLIFTVAPSYRPSVNCAQIPITRMIFD